MENGMKDQEIHLVNQQILIEFLLCVEWVNKLGAHYRYSAIWEKSQDLPKLKYLPQQYSVPKDLSNTSQNQQLQKKRHVTKTKRGKN